MTNTKTLTYTRPHIGEVGDYALEWLKFMEREHPRQLQEMFADGSLFSVAQSVDDSAWEYRKLLEEQYKKAVPSPNTYLENVKWHRTRNFYVDIIVMRERVLAPYTTP